jgi:hypothetical protein
VTKLSDSVLAALTSAPAQNDLCPFAGLRADKQARIELTLTAFRRKQSHLDAVVAAKSGSYRIVFWDAISGLSHWLIWCLLGHVVGAKEATLKYTGSVVRAS